VGTYDDALVLALARVALRRVRPVQLTLFDYCCEASQ
jgi:uncharacterized protein with von Willebrand factor type A (vWA) domain